MLIIKNILASIIILNNNIEERYIKKNSKSKDNNLQILISSLYLEAGWVIDTISEEFIDSDIIRGALNQAETRQNKYWMY